MIIMRIFKQRCALRLESNQIKMSCLEQAGHFKEKKKGLL